MSATLESVCVSRDDTCERAVAVAVQDARPAASAPDAIEVAACERVVNEELARPGCSAASLVERLLDQGFPPFEAAWEVLWSADRGGPLAGAFARVHVSHLEVLERLALAANSASVRRTLAARIAGHPSAEQVLWIAGHLGEHGSWRDVDLVLGLARVDAPWLGLDPDELAGTVAGALAAILAREPQAHGALIAAVQAEPEDFGAVALDALSRATGGRALATLSELLDRRKLEAAAVVGIIEAVARRSLPPFDEFLLQRLREFAAAEDSELRAAALRALAALNDEESLSLQISGLRFEDGDVRAAAGTALTELTGLQFGSDPERWTSWHAGEIEWWEDAADATLERLEDDDPAVVVAALAELVPHRLYRARLARAVAGLLEHERPELRRLACLTLEQLDGRVVAHALVERLADVDEAVRESAYRCLTALFDLDLPPEIEAWKALLEQGDFVLR